ncbi:hypothetical protein G9A89_001898, partial [Geosiphon pyriformis]
QSQASEKRLYLNYVQEFIGDHFNGKRGCTMLSNQPYISSYLFRLYSSRERLCFDKKYEG